MASAKQPISADRDLVAAMAAGDSEALRSLSARQRSVGQQSDLESSPDPAMEVYQAQRARIVRAALAELDLNERAKLELAYFTDLPQSEDGGKVGNSLSHREDKDAQRDVKLREKLARQPR